MIAEITKVTYTAKATLVSTLNSSTTSIYTTHANDPNEYIIQGDKVSIYRKKFMEDKTLTKCGSSNKTLMTYTYFTTMIAQYVVYITTLDNIYLWINPSIDKSPILPFTYSNFKSIDDYDAVYTTTSLAIEIQLKMQVIFGESYKAITHIINDHEINGFEILYNMISFTHPKLLKNKVRSPDKLVLEDNLPQYINRYRN